MIDDVEMLKYVRNVPSETIASAHKVNRLNFAIVFLAHERLYLFGKKCEIFVYYFKFNKFVKLNLSLFFQQRLVSDVQSYKGSYCEGPTLSALVIIQS